MPMPANSKGRARFTQRKMGVRFGSFMIFSLEMSDDFADCDDGEPATVGYAQVKPEKM
jgi:hypothetical protein